MKPEFEISTTIRLRPTPDILDALEKDYPLEASVADLIDNSIDAGAKRVLIRFLMNADRLVSLCVVDNGRGMTSVQIDHAMQFARKRQYGSYDLGMFGVGLKTASLSHASMLTVISRRRGSGVVGRQWTKEGIKNRDWQLNVLSSSSASAALRRNWGSLGRLSNGTIVRWDRVDDFDRLRQGVDAYIERAKLKLQAHLGLRLHRFLEKRHLRIEIDVENQDSGKIGPPTSVAALNPFPPKERTGATGYPKIFLVRLPRHNPLELRGHIWRKRSKDDGYRLGGGRVAEHQGFYFYRHGRLIQDGGWNDILGTNEPHMSLARVEVDIPDQLSSYLKVRSNKNGVDVPASFADAVLESQSRDGTTFTSYLRKAEEVYRTRGEQKPRPMLKPGDGIPAEVRKCLELGGVPLIRGESCSVVWGSVSDGHFIDVDHANRQVILNSKYRRLLLRGANGSRTDLPLVRTLLYFVFENALAGDRMSKLDRLRISSITSAMNVALRAERRWVEE